MHINTSTDDIYELTFTIPAHLIWAFSALTDALERGAADGSGASASATEACALGRLDGRVGRVHADRRGLAHVAQPQRGARDRVQDGHAGLRIGLCSQIEEWLRASSKGWRLWRLSVPSRPDHNAFTFTQTCVKTARSVTLVLFTLVILFKCVERRNFFSSLI